MKMKSQIPSQTSVRCREAVIAAIQPFKTQLTGEEILAILAYTVGQAIALQDQRTMTTEGVWQLIGSNIEAGNAHIISELTEKSEGTA